MSHCLKWTIFDAKSYCFRYRFVIVRESSVRSFSLEMAAIINLTFNIVQRYRFVSSYRFLEWKQNMAHGGSWKTKRIGAGVFTNSQMVHQCDCLICIYWLPWSVMMTILLLLIRSTTHWPKYRNTQDLFFFLWSLLNQSHCQIRRNPDLSVIVSTQQCVTSYWCQIRFIPIPMYQNVLTVGEERLPYQRTGVWQACLT